MGEFIRSRVRAFGYAFEGLGYVLKTQKNAWIHFSAGLLVIIVGILLNISPSNWAVIFLTIGLVWAAECMNTALESLVDLISPQNHPLAKTAKDVAAAAVLVTAITASLVGVMIFGPYLLNLMSIH